MKKIVTIALSLVAALPVLAGGGNKTIYSKLNITATGAGLVYASNQESETPNYQPSQHEAQQESTVGTDVNTVNHTYHIYAQPQDGNYFAGWFTSESEEMPLSEDQHYSYTISASSTDGSNPTTVSLIARFREITHTFYSTLIATCVGDGQGHVAVSLTDTDTPDFNTSASALQGSMNQHHIYRLYAEALEGYRFGGWYKDAECTQLISMSEKTTFGVDTENIDEETPEEFHAYARFFTPGTEVYQLKNSGFEDWEEVGGGNKEPKNWNSFVTGTGDYISMAGVNQINPSDDHHSGKLSAHIWARNVMFGIKAQGNLTTGCINAGSMSATDANGNYNYTRREEPTQSHVFTGRPDAFRVWVKSKTAGQFKIAALLHADGFYQDPQPTNGREMAQLIAEASQAPANNAETWTEYTIPFTYSSEERPAYALVSFATSNVPGGGAADDLLWVDDIEMIYYSELQSATFNGRRLSFDAEGHANCSDSFDATLLSLTAKGVAASIVTDYDEEEKVLTITVMGDNIYEDPSNRHQYTIAFEKQEGPIIIPTGTYAINMDPSQPATRTADRPLTALYISENGKTFNEVKTDPALVYNDLSETIIEIDPMAEVIIEADYQKGNQGTMVWMHPYLYVDLDQDGEFQVYADEEYHIADGDILSYGFYSFSLNDEKGWDTYSTVITGDDRAPRLNAAGRLEMGEFFAPDEPGFYRLRAKIDWNSIDPAGSLGSEGSVTGANGIVSNGGYIVDLTLRVRGEITSVCTPIAVATPATAIYDLQGRQQLTQPKRGLFIQGGKKHLAK